MNKQCDFAKPKSKPSKSNPDASKVLTYLSAERVHRISVVTLCKFRCRSTMNASRSKSLCWNDDTSYALGLYRLISNSLGIWPLTCHEFGSKVIFVIAIILQLHVAYNLIHEFASGCVQIANATDFLALLAADLSCMLKTCVIRLHWKDMYRIVDSAVKDWSIDRAKLSCEIMYKYAYRARLISVIPLSMALLSLVPMILYAPPTPATTVHGGSDVNNTSISEMKNLPMGTGCSVVHWPNYLYLTFYIYQCIQLVCMCFCNLGCDAVFFGLSMHLCAQFKLLCIDIAELGQHHAKSGIGMDIRASIERHNHLLRLLNLVEDIFNVIIFGLLAATGSHIILLGIEILFSLRDGAFMTVAYSSIAITCLLVQLYAYCFMGDYLSSHAENLRVAAYSCTWYNFPTSLTRDILFLIIKSSKTNQLTAGKVVRMNMENFTSIIKTMASFFSFMKLTVVK